MDRLKKSILVTFGILAASQSLIVAAVGLLFRLDTGRALAFLGATILYHGLLLFLFLSQRQLFVYVEDHRPLERINVSNVLSTIRLSSLPILLFLLTSAKAADVVPIILPYAVIVFLTDFVDGRLARKRGEITRVGRYLDAFSDYCVLGLTLFALLWYGLLPAWVFWLVLARLGTMALRSLVIHLIQDHVEPATSFLGKASVFSIMTMFAAALLQLVPLQEQAHMRFVDLFVNRLNWMVAGVLVVSTVEKIAFFRGELRSALEKRRRTRS